MDVTDLLPAEVEAAVIAPSVTRRPYLDLSETYPKYLIPIFQPIKNYVIRKKPPLVSH